MLTKNIRIFHELDGRTEALWLQTFFKLCGCQVVSFPINSSIPKCSINTMDILLCPTMAENEIKEFINDNCRYFGVCTSSYFFASSYHQAYGIPKSPYFKINEKEEFVSFIGKIAKHICLEEKCAPQMTNLAQFYTENDNALYKCIYIIENFYRGKPEKI